MDIKEKVVIFSHGGSFTDKNLLMDIPQPIITTSGQYKSGKIIDLTLVIDGIDKIPSIDLIFFPEEPTVTSSPGTKLILPFSQLKTCAGRIQVVSDDFANVGGCSIANLFNVNMTFLVKELYMIAVYQSSLPFCYNPNSISISIGYELGNCG
jgi:hypothetical protein